MEKTTWYGHHDASADISKNVTFELHLSNSPVMFLTKDQSKWRWINADGSLGSVVDMDDLLNMQEWLMQTVPTVGQ